MPPSPTPSERSIQNAAALAKEKEEQAQLPYRWTQTIRDLDITVPVPGTLRGKDILVDVKAEYLKVGVRGQDAIIDGPLPHAILPSESTWTLSSTGSTSSSSSSTSSTSSTKEIALHLDKRNAMQWWDCVVTTSPFRIDTARIVPENSQLGDLDGETRGMVEKMMWEQRQKEKSAGGGGGAGGGGFGVGGGDSRKEDALRRFREQHPEMDFSKAKIG